MLKTIHRSALLKILIVSYFVALFVAGEFRPGILFADFFLPVFVFLTAVRGKQVSSGIFLAAFLLLSYTVFLAIISVVSESNSPFTAFALSLRTFSFLIAAIFGYLYYKDIIEARIYYLPIVAALCFIVFAHNVLEGTRAYYGYSQIPSTHAPAISGFTLSALGFFALLLTRVLDFQKKNVTLVSAAFLLFLAIMTFSLSALFSLLGASLVVVLLYFIRNRSGLYSKIFVMAGFALAIPFSIFNINEILEYFYRVEHVIPKLENRLDKVSRIAELMCQSVGCHLFGTGPGSHTYFNRGILGETSMLAFDQLYMRLLVEWGLVGSFLWFLFFFRLLQVKIYVGGRFRFNSYLLAFVLFGLLFGIGSEFIFVAYSGQLYGVLLGTLAGLLTASRFRQRRHVDRVGVHGGLVQ